MSGSSDDSSDGTTTVHTEPGLPDERSAWGPFRVAAANSLVPEYREWWKANPLNNLRGAAKANLWRRFQAEVVEGKTPLEASQGPYTQTLDDLRMPDLPSATELDEVLGPLPEVPSDELWWGEPDPAIYAESTNHLSKRQIAEEVEKGNIVTLRKFREMMGRADEWELKALQELILLHKARTELVIPTGEGTHISFWDLYNYVHNNPELKALAERGVNAADAAAGMTREERIRLLEEVAPWTCDQESEQMRLPLRVTKGLPWGLLAAGSHYSRRPTRWLKGLDGKQDFAYGLYVHEAETAAVMGPKWAGQRPEKVVGSPEYFDDLLAAGPLVGMTLMAVTSRPLPLEEATSAWGDRLRQHMERLASSSEAGPSSAPVPSCCSGKAKAGSGGDALAAAVPRPVFGPLEASQAQLEDLRRLFDPQRLAEQTVLLEPPRATSSGGGGSGHVLRQGAAILFSAAPNGGLLVHAISPGKVREQEHYLLGAVADARLAAALFGMFLHPQRCLDADVSRRAGYNALWYVNGFKSFNADGNPNARLATAPAPRAVRLPQRGRGARWDLPPAGQDPRAAAPELLDGVKQAVMFRQVQLAFHRAWAAADAVERAPGMDERDWVFKRKRAAEEALKAALGGLGLNVQGLELRMPELSPDLAATARPLEA